jgi:hypothetical protein
LTARSGACPDIDRPVVLATLWWAVHLRQKGDRRVTHPAPNRFGGLGRRGQVGEGRVSANQGDQVRTPIGRVLRNRTVRHGQKDIARRQRDGRAGRRCHTTRSALSHTRSEQGEESSVGGQK